MEFGPLTYALGAMLGGGWIGLGFVVRQVLRGDLAPGALIRAKDRELDALKATNAEDRRQLAMLLTETVPAINTLLNTLRAKAERSEP